MDKWTAYQYGSEWVVERTGDHNIVSALARNLTEYEAKSIANARENADIRSEVRQEAWELLRLCVSNTTDVYFKVELILSSVKRIRGILERKCND